MKIGVIALQGDVSEHVHAMEKALEGRGSVIEIRRPGLVSECDGLVLPGGESTTISRQLESSGIRDEIMGAVRLGVPLLATCAGLVLVSKKIDGDTKVKPLGLMDITIGRNVFGSQRESFEADLPVSGFDKPYRAVFIRAPAIVDAEKGVEVLASIDRDIVVAARQGNIMCLAFHPELTSDMRFHKEFLRMIGGV
ncbi:MAG TPA: pyridoxal 5'-phosphate synthase glutaminase subunit PdxT [Methanotrichaceae archaeon]|nr:pyridoxal 5'-phosphate synthase glutaminase subunit PdxT [Methanotrichaceae archaeon]